MKNRILLLVCSAMLLAGNMAYAQNMYDALRFSEQNSQGTARSVAMGNAFVALGGDIGGIFINPAATGVYKYHEASITASLSSNSTTNTYLGNSITRNNTTIDLGNVGIVGTFKTGRQNKGLINWNLGIVLNKYQTFYKIDAAGGRTGSSSYLASLASGTNGRNATSLDMYDGYDPFASTNASWGSILAWNASLLDTLPGTNNSYIAATENRSGNDIYMAGELDQKYVRDVKGSMSEIMINFGGNFSNKLFFGVNIGIHSISYRYSHRYSESAVNTAQFNSQFKEFSAGYSQKTTGTGFDIKAGLIFLPVNNLRIGASISTPTWMFLYDRWAEDISCSFTDGYQQYIESPLGEYDYKLNTPLRWNVGAAYTFGTKGVISVDYEQVNYGKSKLADDYVYSDNFVNENKDIEQTLKLSHIVRVGAEANITKGFSLRGGYQFYSSPFGSGYNPNQIISFGLGYSSDSGYFIDLAYQQKLNTTESFTFYDDVYDSGNLIYQAPVCESTNKLFNLFLTFGVRF